MNRLKLAAFVLFIFAVAGTRCARADDYLTYTCCSWHAERHNLGPQDKNFQETNHGLGLEHQISSKLSLTAGEYSNSIYRHSNYLGVLYYPYSLHHLKFGAFIGGITGYSSRRFGEPAVIPTITYQRKWWGINLEALTVPPLTKGMYKWNTHKAIFALQFKVRIP